MINHRFFYRILPMTQNTANLEQLTALSFYRKDIFLV